MLPSSWEWPLKMLPARVPHHLARPSFMATLATLLTGDMGERNKTCWDCSLRLHVPGLRCIDSHWDLARAPRT